MKGVGKPRYKHDCDKCVWLGSICYPAPLLDDTCPMRYADLYVCMTSIGGPSIIARNSSFGPGYSSMPASIIRDYFIKPLTCVPAVGVKLAMSTCEPALITAYIFAKAKGLV